MKRTYRVFVREIHQQPYLVDAENAQEAKELVADGQGEMEESGFEFVESRDMYFWPEPELCKTVAVECPECTYGWESPNPEKDHCPRCYDSTGNLIVARIVEQEEEGGIHDDAQIRG